MTMSADEVKERYRATRTRARVFVWVVCPLALTLPLVARWIAASMGVDLPGAVGLGIFLGTCALLAVAGIALFRCPACNAYIGSPPLHRWGQPRKCARCGVALS